MNNTFPLKLWTTMGVLLLFALLMLLGIWQLYRYYDKKKILLYYQHMQHANPITLSVLQQKPSIDFQRLRISGYYLNHATILLQNRFHDHHAGWEILTPFKIVGTKDKRLLLINRGFIPKHINQTTIHLPPIATKQTLTGTVRVIHKPRFIVGKNILYPDAHPLQAQRIDFKSFQHITQLKFYPFVLQLDSGQAHGFNCVWKPLTILPKRHMAYAIQWFSMALVLVLIIIYRFWNKNNHE